MIDWNTSSYSGANNNCVQVAATPAYEVAVENKDTNGEEVFVVRDSKNPDKAPLVFTRPEWDAFVDGVKDGEFDSEKLAAKQTTPA